MAILRILGLFLLFLASCGGKKNEFDYKIALDPQWYSLELPGKEAAITAFSSELIAAIGLEENLNLGVFQRSWSNLMLGLQDNSYQAICSALQPYLFYEKLYSFSDVYLPLGPVIVTGIDSKFKNLEELSGFEVGIVQGSNYALILEKYPAIIQRSYGALQPALDDVKQGILQAAIVDFQTAEAFTRDLYQGQLKISSPPLTQDGVRLLGLQGSSDDLIKKFNAGLRKLQKNGTYTKIAQKWGVAVE